MVGGLESAGGTEEMSEEEEPGDFFVNQQVNSNDGLVLK